MKSLRTLLAAICMLCASAAQSATETIDYRHFFRLHERNSIGELMKMAKAPRAREHYDTAAAFYTMVASRYADDLTASEIRSCAIANANMGYIWLAWRSNAAEAFPWLMKARDICSRHKIDDVMAGVVSNLGEIYLDYNNYDKAREYMTRAFEETMNLKNDRYFGMTMLDYAVVTLLDPTRAPDEKVIERALSYRVSDHTEPLATYAPVLARALSEYVAGRPEEAAEILRGTKPVFDDTTDSWRYVISDTLVRALIDMKAGLYGEATDTLLDALELSRKKKLYNFMDKCYSLLAECARARGDVKSREHYRNLGLAIRDSLFSVAAFSTLVDLETADSLSTLKEDLITARLNTRRQRDITIILLCVGTVLAALLAWLLISRRRLKEAYTAIFHHNVELARRTQLPAAVGEMAEIPADGAPKEAARDFDMKKGAGLMERIRSFMSTSAEIYNPKFSIDILASALKERPKAVSQTINTLAGKNFNAFLAEYRIREACRLLADPETLRAMTIESVAEKIGYRSRTNFSKVFKEVTGLTPTQFVRETRNNSQKK